MHRNFHSLALAGALLAPAGPAVAQSIAYGEPPPVRPAADRLAEYYRLRLTSAWPQLPAGTDCENGGAETVEGTLTRTGPDAYAVFTAFVYAYFSPALADFSDNADFWKKEQALKRQALVQEGITFLLRQFRKRRGRRTFGQPAGLHDGTLCFEILPDPWQRKREKSIRL